MDQNIQLLISSVEEKKIVENKFNQFLNNIGYSTFTCEGLSINKEHNNININMFERFKVSEESFYLILKEMYSNKDDFKKLKYIFKLAIKNYLYTKEHYKFIIDLLKSKNINYNVIIHDFSCNQFLWITLNLYKNYIDIEFLKDCNNLSKKIYSITNKKENKKFATSKHLECIDKCLRKLNTPYPGNFDGLVYKNENYQPIFIIEYSKVDWVYKFDKNLNYHLKWYCNDYKKKGWKIDINRWSSLKNLGEYLNIPIYIIWWGTKKNEYAVGELLNIKQNCFESINILLNSVTEIEVLAFFKQLLIKN